VPLLTLQNVSLAFGHLPLFEDAGLQIESGERIALIGRNGTGKSTLLRVLSGETPADAGAIWRTPGLKVSRLDQDVPLAGDRTVFDEVAAGLGALSDLVTEYHHAAMDVAASNDPDRLAELGDLQHQLEERDGWRVEQKVEIILSRLALPADTPMRDLSGGWRRRALLGKALVSSPDLLLLDEPTNHLDIDAIGWLEDYLQEYAGPERPGLRTSLVFVTHDRAFLSSLATRIVELDRGALTSWPGNYATYLEKKAAAVETEARDLERLDKKLAQEEAWLRQGVKARRTRNEGRVKALYALRAERAAYRAQSGTAKMSLNASEASGRLVFEAEHVSKGYGGVPVIRDYSQRILRGDRVGLIGPNGSGKTTLLRLLVGEIEPDAGEIRRGTRLEVAYFDQQREQLDPERAVVDSVSDSPTITINGRSKHVVGYLADFLFPRERVHSPVKSLSGGERNRLLLARLFARPANVLVMDEPTNDLDIETLELLEELVGDFEGTVLMVSHDRVFLDNVVTSTLAFEGGGRVTEYVGGYADYLRQRGDRDSGLGARGSRVGSDRRDPSPEPRVPVASRMPAAKKLSFNEQRELATLPAHIEALEAEQQRLKTESESAEFYKATGDHIRAVLARLESVASELETAIARWMELEERQP
jgi:ABC transport system ATP-binding/permease protein